MQTSKSVVWAILGVFGLLTASGMTLHFKWRAERRSEDPALMGVERNAQVHARHNDEARPSRRVVSTAPTPSPSSASEEHIGQLESRIRELEAALDEKNRLLAVRTQPTPREREQGSAPRRQTRNLESLRESNPERYQAIVERREHMREHMDQAFHRKSEFLLSQDRAAMHEAEIEDHDRMLALLHETWDLVEQSQTDLSREERVQTWRTLRRNIAELEPLLNEARNREFRALGQDLGYSAAESETFAEYLNEVVETTSMVDGLLPGRGRRRGRTADPE